jgi:hypothetical protein
MKNKYNRWIVSFTTVLVSVFFSFPSYAAELTPRSLKLGNSSPTSANPNQYSFTIATTSNIGSIGFQYCTAASGACTIPAGLDTTGATLSAQSGSVGFTIVAATNGNPYITRAASNISAGAAVSYTLSNVINPTATNTTYFARITTYSGSDGATGAVDSGTVVASTATPIQLTGVTPPILVFCVGTTITSDCTTIAGNAINFGDFSPVVTRSGTSVMQASSNAGNGYNITVNGTTLASGVNTIAALTSQTASTLGTGQFGLNLRTNASPVVGADPTGSGIGNYSANYGTANQYRFISGDTVAQTTGPSNANTFTSSYIVNIGGSQAAGVYTATLTYICTASF